MKHILKRVTVSARRVAPITQRKRVLEALQEQHSPSQKKVGHLVNRIDSPVIRKKEHVLFKLRVRLCRTVDAFVAG